MRLLSLVILEIIFAIITLLLLNPHRGLGSIEYYYGIFASAPHLFLVIPFWGAAGWITARILVYFRNLEHKNAAILFSSVLWAILILIPYIQTFHFLFYTALVANWAFLWALVTGFIYITAIAWREEKKAIMHTVE